MKTTDGQFPPLRYTCAMMTFRLDSFTLFAASLLVPAALLLVSETASALSIERIELHQKERVQVEHRRRVGNIRTQAQAQGWIVRLPQTYIYFSDFSSVFHMDGYQRGFERQLNSRVSSRRTERSVIGLDRLLENVERLESAEPFTIDDLPPADLYLVLYSKPNCDLCDQVDAELMTWLETLGDVSVVWLDVSMDQLL
jgi:hypothetical protein